jgi:hypothetical protein
MTTPYYVVVWGRTRLLMWGLFDTKAQAEARADEHCRIAPKLRPELKVEPKEGGSVSLTLRVQAAHIDEKIAGRLAMLIGRETRVSITAARAATQDDGDEDDDEREAA